MICTTLYWRRKASTIYTNFHHCFYSFLTVIFQPRTLSHVWTDHNEGDANLRLALGVWRWWSGIINLRFQDLKWLCTLQRLFGKGWWVQKNEPLMQCAPLTGIEESLAAVGSWVERSLLLLLVARTEQRRGNWKERLVCLSSWFWVPPFRSSQALFHPSEHTHALAPSHAVLSQI